MTATSQNGFSANDRALVSSRLVPGTQVRLTVRTGPAGDLLLQVAALFDARVQNIDNARGALDDWGYAERPIRGTTTVLSNHASGTAIDLNATRWPLGSSPSINLSVEQIARVREIVAACGGAVRWGGDYVARKDPMHFEIADGTTEAGCARALAALNAWAAPKPAPPVLKFGMMDSPAVARLQEFLGLVADGDFGEKTRAAVVAFQARSGLVADGVVGPATRAKLAELGFRG